MDVNYSVLGKTEERTWTILRWLSQFKVYLKLNIYFSQQLHQIYILFRA